MKKKTFVIVSIMTITLGITACQKNEESTAITEPVETTESVMESETQSETVTETESTLETESEIVVETESALETESETVDTELSDTATSNEIIIVEELDTTMYAIKNGNIRNGDSTDYDIVDHLEYGATVHVTGKTANNWYEIQLADGTQAYVSASLLQSEKPVAQSSTTTAPSTNTQTPSNNNAGNSSGGGSTTPTTPSNDGYVPASQVINPVTGQPLKDGDMVPGGLIYHETPDWF